MSDQERDPAGADEVESRGDGATERGSTPLTQQVGRIVLVVVAVLFVVFALANAQYVDFSWLFGETAVVESGGERVSGGVPLIVLLLVAFAAGALVSGLFAWQRGRHRGDR